MIPGLTPLLPGLLAAAALSFAAPSPRPPTQQGAPEEQGLADVLRELRELRQGHYANRDLLEEQTRRAREQVVRLRADVDELGREQARIEAAEAAVQAELVELESEADALVAEHEESLAVLRGMFDHLRRLVNDGIPHRVDERLAALGRLEQATTARDAFAHLWSFCEEELRMARSGESYTEEIELADGRVKHARFFRIGRSVLGFVTEDGRDVGLWGGDQGWIERTGSMNQDAVRTAVEILDRRQGPEHVVLPVRVEPRAE